MKSANTVTCDVANAMINLDFDAEGYLIGVEVMDVSQLLRPALLEGGSPA